MYCTVMYSHCYLGLHVRAAGVGGEGSEVAQGLGLLLQRHDAVLLEHPASLSHLSLISALTLA